MNEFLNNLTEETNNEKSLKFNRVKRKLDLLINQKNNFNRNKIQNSNKFSNFHFHERIKNLSTTIFDDDELDLLRLGLKYCIKTPLTEGEILEYAVELDVLIECISNDCSVKKNLRNDIHNILYNLKNNIKKTNFFIPKSSEKTLNNLKTKIKNQNIVLSKADKGNCLVILNKDDYIQKVESFLLENNFTLLTNNPFNSFVRRSHNLIKHFSSFLEEVNAPKTLIHNNPNMPRLYGLPKIHKENIPIRPVVSFTNTPISVLASFIHHLILNLTDFTPKNGVSNTLDLIHKLDNIQLPNNYLLVSYDVTNLFTTVPKAEAVEIVGNLLRSKNLDEDKIINILSLLNLCLSQNFFSFNNKYYQQPDGLAMGSCLSPFLADVFMDHLENTSIISNSNKEILHWYRYVDDCLCFLDCDQQGAERLLTKINNIHPKIAFTLEIENNKKLNFLDLTIHKNEQNLKFSIYRKPTQTDHVIPDQSNHPQQHKMAAFHCYINRLLNFPLSKEDYNSEVNILKQIAHNNNYEPDLIPKLIEKTKYKRIRKEIYPDPPKTNKYIALPFLNNSTNQKVTKCFQQYFSDLKISYKTKNKLSSHLINSKDKIPKLSKSGVYKLSCNSCNSTYIGRTCRPLKTRISEHLNRASSSFGTHIREFKHNFSPTSNSKIIHNITSKNFNRLDFLEDIEITKELQINNSCLNTQVNLNRSYIPLHRRLNS